MVRGTEINGWARKILGILDYPVRGTTQTFAFGEVLGFFLVLPSCRTQASQQVGVSCCKVISGTPQELMHGGSSVELPVPSRLSDLRNLDLECTFCKCYQMSREYTTASN